MYCGQTAKWIRIPLGTEAGLGPGDIVLNGDPAPPPRTGAQQPPLFGACTSIMWPNGRQSHQLLSSCCLTVLLFWVTAGWGGSSNENFGNNWSRFLRGWMPSVTPSLAQCSEHWRELKILTVNHRAMHWHHTFLIHQLIPERKRSYFFLTFLSLNETTAYQFPLTLLHCSICIAFQISVLLCEKASRQQKRKHCIVVCTTRSGINLANLWGPSHNGFTAARSLIAMYGLDAFSLFHFWASADLQAS